MCLTAQAVRRPNMSESLGLSGGGQVGGETAWLADISGPMADTPAGGGRCWPGWTNSGVCGEI